ncbi:malate dehydrogenase [Syntrophorhabdus aromaticivorans]|uniref:malate dehydrogenase n=1 Tax=Syntrophorhabdus aromaticivorans TaxID=328301 RepID=UPI00041421CE|nr:malate dehydrogenase [Syntrophorhabdus aromaticivorans]
MAISKIFIAGAGNIGASCAEVMARKQLGHAHLYDINEDFAAGQVMDINQASPSFGSDTLVHACASIDDLEGSDVVVVAAGVARHAGMSRLDLLQQNRKIVGGIGASIMSYCPHAKVLLITNPVDVLTWYLKDRWPSMNVFGLGCSLDALRFRFFIAEATGTSVNSVAGTVIGLHNNNMVPLVSYATAGGVSIRHMLSESEIEVVINKTKEAGTAIVSKLISRSGFYAASNTIAEIIESMVFNKRAVFPLSIYCNGEFGHHDICLALPAIVGDGGIHRIITYDLDREERRMLDVCADEMKRIIGSLRK